MQKTLVIGAQNTDIFVQTRSDYVLHDSNPAKIHTAVGGVGCNIAVNLALTGNDVSFITVFGNDHFSNGTKNKMHDLKINIDESLIIDKEERSIYLGIMDKNGDLFLGLNDMQIIENLDVNFFTTKNEYIRSFDIIVIDNNLQLESIEYLIKTHKDKKIVTDAVSASKAGKLRNSLQYIHLLKLNMLELNALSDKESTEEKIDDLLNAGLCKILITNSANEIIYKSKDEYIRTMPLKTNNIISSSGAGDAFLSGFIHGMIHSGNTGECMEIAKKTAFLTLRSPNSTNENISKSDIE